MTAGVVVSRTIDLACLDMAGTTVRDDGAVEEAFLAALGEVGVEASDARFPDMIDYVNETMGTSKIEVFKALFPSDDRLPVAANNAFEAAYGVAIANGKIEAIPGAVETFERLQSNGVKVVLLTGFSAVTRDALIDSLGWGDVADLLLCPQEAGRGRPYPDMILAAILRLQIDDVASVVVVGDTASDIISGRRGGASIVAGVLTGADKRERLIGAGATSVIDSIADLPDLIARELGTSSPHSKVQ